MFTDTYRDVLVHKGGAFMQLSAFSPLNYLAAAAEAIRLTTALDIPCRPLAEGPPHSC